MSTSTQFSRRFVVAIGTAILTLAASSSEATGVFLSQCDTCESLAQFETEAAAEAVRRGTLGGGTVGLGTYVVTNRVSPKTAIVMVRGYRYQVCDGNGECRYRLMVTSASAVNESGQPAILDDLNKIDGVLLGMNKAAPIQPVSISENYTSSFVGSEDHEVGPGINNALMNRGINAGPLPLGTLVTAIFADGSKATFIRVSATGSLQWQWAGAAWNSAGKRINRDGSLRPGGIAGATGVGEVNGGGSVAGFWRFVASQSCQIGTSIWDPSGGFTYTVWNRIPC